MVGAQGVAHSGYVGAERARGESLGALLRDSESFLGELTSALDRGQGYTRRQLKLVTATQHQRLTVDLTVTPLSDCETPALLLELLPVDRALRIHRETQQQRVQEDLPIPQSPLS